MTYFPFSGKHLKMHQLPRHSPIPYPNGLLHIPVSPPNAGVISVQLLCSYHVPSLLGMEVWLIIPCWYLPPRHSDLRSKKETERRILPTWWWQFIIQSYQRKIQLHAI